jgi:hypothetical protein
LRAPSGARNVAGTLAPARLRQWRGIGTREDAASSQVGRRGAFFVCFLHREGVMTAQHRKAVAKKQASPRAPAPDSVPVSVPGSGWPGVVRYALENWPRTVRLCVIVVVVGAVLLLAVHLGFRLWL